jgi:hypothetical protein
MGEHPRIFISYRREDSSGHAGRLFDGLCERFGESQVFMDVDGIPPGVDFWQKICEVIDSCAVALVVIGHGWLSSASETGRRLDDPNDWVRQEIAVALKRDGMTLPILFNETKMPSEHELPEEIRPLVLLNVLRMRDDRWHVDLDMLVSVIKNEITRTAPEAAFEEVPIDDWNRKKLRWPWRR